ncbi:MAG: TlpA family protein disulfide reductase [Thiocapsa sp.]|jgi:peroxiredoxin|nr:TlpA disulfide reductase family protein [Thiocapsa sp.]MCG6895589.1 TlpA family protein disulfide reductase [Thiocapsa sp.]MCG6985932.1 TlpA family protein disulfide reductase [Thiocapsa sp.]
MSPLKVGAVAVLAGGISVGIAVLGQRWLSEPLPNAELSGAAQLQTLPDFRLTDTEGHEVQSGAWSGKILVIHYWASWCPPCVREMPLFIHAQETLGKAGVQVVGIAVDRLEDVAEFVARYPVNYPILIANPEAVALSRRLGNRVEGLPFTVIFDRRGRRVFSRTGEITAAELERQLGGLINAAGHGAPSEEAS